MNPVSPYLVLDASTPLLVPYLMFRFLSGSSVLGHGRWCMPGNASSTLVNFGGQATKNVISHCIAHDCAKNPRSTGVVTSSEY